MYFLATNEIAEWCQQHHVPLDTSWNLPADWQPAPLPAYQARLEFGENGRSGREQGLATEITRAIGQWKECLLWVTQWGVWPSSEDWPRYYALRGTHRELRSVEEAPGHLFSADEGGILAEFLTVVMENGWDAFILSAPIGPCVSASAFISHDGWVELYTPLAMTTEHSTSKAIRTTAKRTQLGFH